MKRLAVWICSLRNHRSHYTTLSVNVNSFEVFFSSVRTKKSCLRKRKTRFFVHFVRRFFIFPLTSRPKAPLGLWLISQNRNQSDSILCNRTLGRKSFFTCQTNEKRQIKCKKSSITLEQTAFLCYHTYSGAKSSAARNTARHPAFVLYYNPKFPNSTYPYQFSAIQPNQPALKRAYCRNKRIVDNFIFPIIKKSPLQKALERIDLHWTNSESC